MKIELGQFYLFRQTIYMFTEDFKDSFRGRMWSRGLSRTVVIDKRKEELNDFIPIDYAIAKMVQSGQAIDTGLV